jgi:thymidylate synthase (FAD)
LKLPDYSDSGHRPHADHKGEVPKGGIMRGPYAIEVELRLWGPKDALFTEMFNVLQANWGDRPSGQDYLGQKQEAYVEKCFAGQTLQQILEGIHFWFLIDGVSRACTHQLVRTRIGAAMMQHGGRDNDWRHRDWTMPETVYRACARMDMKEASEKGDFGESCITDMTPIKQYIQRKRRGYTSLWAVISDYLQEGKQLYAALVDAGIPWQDARRLLPIGTQTYIHINYTYLALKGMLANRLEHVMDWEINCVAQLMLREIRMQCPEMMWKYLGSHSDRQERAVFKDLESWPPDQKYPADYVPETRTHRPAQNPFWVLHPSSMAGGPIHWVQTDGVYPDQLRKG